MTKRILNIYLSFKPLNFPAAKILSLNEFVAGCHLFDSAEPGRVGNLHIWPPETNDDDPRADILRPLWPRLHMDHPSAHHHPDHHLLQVRVHNNVHDYMIMYEVQVPLPGNAGGVLEEQLHERGVDLKLILMIFCHSLTVIILL